MTRNVERAVASLRPSGQGSDSLSLPKVPQLADGLGRQILQKLFDLYDHDPAQRLLKLCNACGALNPFFQQFLGYLPNSNQACIGSIVVTNEADKRLTSLPFETRLLDRSDAAWVKIELREDGDPEKPLQGVVSFDKVNFLSLIDRVTSNQSPDGLQAVIWRPPQGTGSGDTERVIRRANGWEAIP